jgi:hypothetical protein
VQAPVQGVFDCGFKVVEGERRGGSGGREKRLDCGFKARTPHTQEPPLNYTQEERN